MKKFLLIIICLALFILAAVAPGPASCAELPKEVKSAVEEAAKFYDKMGQKDIGNKLRANLKDGKIKYGATQGGNAEHSFITGNITLSDSVYNAVKSPPDFDAVGSMAQALAHEMVHQEQRSLSWSASSWQEVFGYGNPCEQEAWGDQCRNLGKWIKKLTIELDGVPEKDSAKRLELAKQVAALGNDLNNMHFNYFKDQNYGPLNVDALGMVPGKTSIPLAQFQKLFQTDIENAKAIVAKLGSKYDGIYKGTLTIEKGVLITNFTINRQTQSNKYSVLYGTIEEFNNKQNRITYITSIHASVDDSGKIIKGHGSRKRVEVQPETQEAKKQKPEYVGNPTTAEEVAAQISRNMAANEAQTKAVIAEVLGNLEVKKVKGITLGGQIKPDGTAALIVTTIYEKGEPSQGTVTAKRIGDVPKKK